MTHYAECPVCDRNHLIVLEYEYGQSLRETAKTFNLSHEMIRKILLRSGVKIRAPHKWHKSPVDTATDIA